MTVVDLARLIRRHWIVLAIGILLGVLVASGYTLTRPRLFASSATGVVIAGDTLSVNNTQSGDTVTIQRSQMYAELGNTASVVQRRNALLEKDGHAAAERGSVSVVAASDGGPFIQVSATADTPQNAQALAQAELSSVISEALRLETFAKTNGQGGYTDAQLSKMTTIHVLAYAPAQLPSTPVRTHVLRNLLLGAGAGALLAIAWIGIRRAFDLKIRSRQQVEELTSRSVLGVIPESKTLRLRGEKTQLATGPAGEALRQLRTNLRFVNVDGAARAIVVTSPAPGDGKSTIAAQLARIIALSGEPVVLVDCDLRLPTQAPRFGVDGEVGLTQVLTRDIEVADVLVPTDTDRLWLLPAGRIPPNPSEILGSDAMRTLVADLSARYLVILDAPPLLAVTDGALLASGADGVVLVTKLGSTHKAQVTLSTELLAQANATLLGSVINRAPAKEMGQAMYGTDYGYSGGHEFKGYADYQRNHSARPEAEAEPAHVSGAAQSARLPVVSSRGARRERENVGSRRSRRS